MMKSSANEIPELISGPTQTARRMARPVDRKQVKDPMKLFPYLFQFVSPRLSETANSAATATPLETPQNQSFTRRPMFLAFRSPSDQLCVIAVPPCQVNDRSARFPDWTH
jgi:hypothetical protein